MLEIKTDVIRLRTNLTLRLAGNLFIVLICFLAALNQIKNINIFYRLSFGGVGVFIFVRHFFDPKLYQLIILAFKKSHVICSISQKGFTDHRTNRDYYWEDLEKIFVQGGDRISQLLFVLKDNLGTVYLEEICASHEANKEMLLYILKYAPKNLTHGVSVYRDKDKAFAVLCALTSPVIAFYTVPLFPHLPIFGFSYSTEFTMLFLMVAIPIIYPIYYFVIRKK